ncbi:MAG TPA: hypothetical protein VF788_13125, partial [Pseudonocardiaceae bacterium]
MPTNAPPKAKRTSETDDAGSFIPVTYVLLLAVGFRSGATAPVFSDVPVGSRVVDPVVQALSLTDIVVSATITALLLALTIQIYKR